MGLYDRVLRTPPRRAMRRLLVAIVVLLAIDRLVPSILRRLEFERYEQGAAFRFENSDLFALGPLISYLQENPRSTKRRVVFLGNSVIFGYGLKPEESLPAAYERLHPGTRVINAGVNGSLAGGQYLIAKSLGTSIDTIFAQVTLSGANPMLGRILPVTAEEIETFKLDAPDRLEGVLSGSFARMLRLHASNHRLQAALFGTSTRQYIYLKQKALLQRRVGSTHPAEPSGFASPSGITWRIPKDLGPPDPKGDAGYAKRLLPMANLARTRKQRVVLLEFELPGRPLDDGPRAAFNRAHAPYAQIVILTAPQSLLLDPHHLSRDGAAAAAAALTEYEERHLR
jgi:lysophospholipase L1-like esterase